MGFFDVGYSMTNRNVTTKLARKKYYDRDVLKPAGHLESRVHSYGATAAESH